MMLGGASSSAHTPAVRSGAAAAHEGSQRKSGTRDFADLLGGASGAGAEAATGADQASPPEARPQAEKTAARQATETRRHGQADAGTDAGIDADVETDVDGESDTALHNDAQGSAVDAGAADSGATPDADTPPLLNWLFGLMAATGSRGVPTVPVEVAAPPAQPHPMSQMTAAGAAGAQGTAESPLGTETAPSLAPATDPTAVLVDSLVPADSADFSAEMLAAAPDASSRQLPQPATAMMFGAAEPRQAASAAPSQAAANALLSPLSPEFIPDLGEHIVWQLDQGVSEAKIELHPAELGALTVRIETRGDQASVHIVAAEAGTRAMLSQALPQLRELLSGSGLQLARSHIESAGRRDERSGERGPAPHAEPGARRRVSRVVLVDAYA